MLFDMSKKKVATKPKKKAVRKTSKKVTKKTATKRKMSKKTPSKKSSPKKVSKVAKVSPVKGKSVAWYIGTLEDWQQVVVREIDKIILSAAPKSTSSIKWAQPVYESNGPFAFMKAAKKHVTFGFWRGTDLDDEKSLFEGAGKKMRHIKVRSLDDVHKTVFKKMVKQAVKLNKQFGDPS